MRFERIVVGHFGRLAGFDTGDEALPGLVVVHGPNEAGKSTLFRFLTSLLYGFSPATRERHPYSPWSGDDIEGAADISLADGMRVRVHRRLLSAPWGRLHRNGQDEDLRNNPVPWAATVHPSVFENVYALTLSDLARLHDDAWHRVQDRLLGSMGAEDVRPAREIADELEREAAALWRSDRRGSPRARALQDELTKLRRARAESASRDAEMRKLSRELDELEAELDSLRVERVELKVLIDRLAVLLPVRQHLARIHELEVAAGDAAELDGIPESPRAELETLAAETERCETEIKVLSDRRERPDAAMDAFTSADSALLEQAPSIREMFMRSGEIREAAARLGSVTARIAQLEGDCESRARELLSVPWLAVDVARIRSLPLGEVRERVWRYREAAEELGQRQAKLDALRAVPEQQSGLGMLPGAPSMLVLAAALVAGGLLLDISAVVTLGLVAAGLGALRLWAQRSGSADAGRGAAIDRAREDREEAARSVEELRSGVARSLEGVPVSGALLERPGPELVQALEVLVDKAAELEAARAEARDLGERIGQTEGRVRQIGADLGRPLPADIVAAMLALDSELREAQLRESAAAAARNELRELDRTEAAVRERLEEWQLRLQSLRQLVARLGDGDPGRGIELAEARLAHRRRAEELRDELERANPDLEELKLRIQDAEDRVEEWTRDDHAHVRARERVDSINERERELIGAVKDRRHELGRLESLPTLDHVEGAIEAVRHELAEICRERDRLVLLARLVRRADRQFRDENQPDLLRRAGDHLSRITEGRYARLELPDDPADGSLALHAPGRPEPLEVAEPVSNGTRDQVYLALRLAIVDHLDAAGERLPLFVDEAFVNWDSLRMERGAELLQDLGRDRQVFVFTCHMSLVESLQVRGARVLRMPEPT